MEKKPETLNPSDSYDNKNSEKKLKKENLEKEQAIETEIANNRSIRFRRLITNYIQRKKSREAAKEIQNAKKSSAKSKEQMVEASADPNMMVKLLKRLKRNKKNIKKANKKLDNAETIDKFDGTLF